MAFYVFHRHRVCLVDRVDLICSLYSWWESFGSSSLAALPLGFNCGFIFTSTCGSSTGVYLLRLPWKAWVCPWEGQVWRWCRCLGPRDSGSTRYSGGLAARTAGNSALEGYGNQYWPIRSSILAWRTPSLTENPGRPWSTGSQSLTQPKWPCTYRLKTFFACGSSTQWELSMKVVQLLGLWRPWWHQVCRDTDCLPHGVMALSESFLEPLVAGNQKVSLASLSL